MLVMIKLGWLTKMQEKEYNYYIQLWMRAPGEWSKWCGHHHHLIHAPSPPGCVFHAILTWANFVDAWNRHTSGQPARAQGVPEPFISPEMARFAVWVSLEWRLRGLEQG